MTYNYKFISYDKMMIMRNPFFSIIIPVYNAEKNIQECLESILTQEFREIEIIVINDGSLDKSVEIINQFIVNDYRVKLLNEQNHGISFARNSGLKHATGEWIIFVDSDDYIEKGSLLRIYNKIKNSTENIYVCKWRRFVEKNNNREFSKIIGINKENKISFHHLHILLDYYDRNYDWAVWKLIIKKKYLRENNIYFNNEIRNGEDLYWIPKLFMHDKKINSLDILFYNYRENPTGSLSELSRENSLNWLNSMLITENSILKNNIEDAEYILARVAFVDFSYLLYYIGDNFNENLSICREHIHLLKYLRKGSSTKVKMFGCLATLNEYMLLFLLKILKKIYIS